MTKALTEADGLSWREKLPPIPTVPLAVREKLSQKTSGGATQPKATAEQNNTRQTNKPGEMSFLILTDKSELVCISTLHFTKGKTASHIFQWETFGRTWLSRRLLCVQFEIQV